MQSSVLLDNCKKYKLKCNELSVFTLSSKVTFDHLTGCSNIRTASHTLKITRWSSSIHLAYVFFLFKKNNCENVNSCWFVQFLRSHNTSCFMYFIKPINFIVLRFECSYTSIFLSFSFFHFVFLFFFSIV